MDRRKGRSGRQHIRQRLVGLYLAFLIVYTVLLQLPELRQIGLARYGLFAIWLFALGGYAVASRPRYSPNIAKLIALILIVDSYSFIMEVVRLENYTGSPLFYNLNMAGLFIFIGYLLSGLIDRDTLVWACRAYALAVLAVAPYIIIGNLHAQQVYDAKNSLGPITVFATIIVVALINPQSRIARFVRAALAALLIVCVFTSYNRASMTSLVILALYYILVCLPTVKSKVAATALLTAVTAVCLASDAVRQTLEETTRISIAGGDVDLLSSGRIEIFKAAWQMFLGSPIFGVGEQYVENFHCSALVQLGILGSLPVFLLYLHPVRSFVARLGLVRSDPLALTIALMAVHGVVISVFEEQAPFGQGTAYFILWLLVGYYEGSASCKRNIRRCSM